jgi:hypothetical protein
VVLSRQQRKHSSSLLPINKNALALPQQQLQRSPPTRILIVASWSAMSRRTAMLNMCSRPP